MVRRSWILVGLVAGVCACSGRDEALGIEGRGSDVCLNYQDALCDWVLRCTPNVTRQQCEASASSITCAPEGPALSCTRAIDLSDCKSPPDDCELFDVADRAPAQRACEDFGRAYCAAQVGCDASSASECAGELEALDCSLTVGVKAGYGACLEALAQPDCAALPPASCQDILLSEPGAGD